MEAQTRIIAKEVIDDYNVDKNLAKLENAIIALQQQLNIAKDAEIQEEIQQELQILLNFKNEELGNHSGTPFESDRGAQRVQLHPKNLSGANTNQQSAQVKAPHLVSITLEGLYSFNKRRNFSLVNKKMILVGPNNSGKSNLIRAIILCLSYAPGGPSREVMEELKFFGPEMNNEPCFISLQFELDDGTIEFIADALVYPLVAQFPVTSINKEQVNLLLKLRDKIKSRIRAVHLICRELSEKNSHGEPCYESYGVITDRVVENYVPFFDEVKEDTQQFMIYDSTCHSLSLTTMKESLNPKLKSIVALYDEIRNELGHILGFGFSPNSASWLNCVEKVDGLKTPEDFVEKLKSYNDNDSWTSDKCLDLGSPLANLLREYVAILPQDRGLISYDRHNTNLQKFTIEKVIKSLTAANRCASKSVQYRNLKRIIALMKEFSIILSMPLSPSQACEVFVYETASEIDNEVMQTKINTQMISGNENVKLICKRMLSFLNLPDIDRTVKKAQRDLLIITGVSNIPEYEKERNSVFAILLDREIGPDDKMKHRDGSSYHDVNPTLKEYDVIRFSTSDNTTKKLSLGALYGAAQQFLIIFTTLLMGDIGTVLLDEPETSMHTSSKASLKQLIQSSACSMIIVTHAEEFISERLLQCTYHCVRVKASTVVTSVFEIIEMISPQRAPLRAVSSDARPLFFLERVLFVEGPNDARLFDALQHLVKEDDQVQNKLRELNIDLKKLSSWCAINLAGCENAPFLCNLAEKLIPWCVILDRDVFENKTAKQVKTRFKNKAIYPLIEKLYPQMKLLEEIEKIADQEPDTTVTMKENAEIEQVEECKDDKITKKEKIDAIKKRYKDSLFEEKSARIMQLFDNINQIFAWKGEMEHTFLQPKDAAVLLHQNCTSDIKHEDVDQFILRKKTNDSLHDLWSFIKFSKILDAVKLLVIHENEEFISFCRYLSEF